MGKSWQILTVDGLEAEGLNIDSVKKGCFVLRSSERVR